MLESLQRLRWTCVHGIGVAGGQGFPMIGDSGEQVDQLAALGRVERVEKGLGLLGEGSGRLPLRLLAPAR